MARFSDWDFVGEIKQLALSYIKMLTQKEIRRDLFYFQMYYPSFRFFVVVVLRVVASFK